MTTVEPQTTASAREAVDQLIDTGLPSPRTVTVRQHRDEVSLSLMLFDAEDLDAWRQQLVTVGAVDDGPWPVGPREYRVAVGRLAGVMTVLAAEQGDDATAGAR